MSYTETSGSEKRHALSPKYRVWLLVWSLIRLVVLLPIWLLAIVTLILGVALSPWGTGVLLSQGEQRDFFSYTQYEGALLDHFELEGFQLEMGATRIAVEAFEIEWADDCVLSGRLCIDTLRVEGADIRLGAASQTQEQAPAESNGSPLSVRFPFPIELRSLLLDDVSLRLADGTQVNWHSLRSGAVAEGREVRLSATHLAQPRLYLPPSPGVLLTQHSNTRLNAEAIDAASVVINPPQEATEQADESFADTLRSRDRLELPEITLPVDVQIPEFTLDDFRLEGAAEYRVERLRLSVSTNDNNVELTELSVVTPDAQAELTANATLSGNYPLEARLSVELFLPEIRPELFQQQGSETLVLELAGTLDALEAQLDASGPLNISLSGQVDALSPTLPFQLSVESDQVRWPLPAPEAHNEGEEQGDEEATQSDSNATEPYIVDDLALQLSGSLSDYRAQLALAVEGPSLPRTQVDLSGEGDLEHFSWQPLTLAVGESALRSEGSIHWLAPLRIDANVKLNEFDPGHFVDQLNGNLNGDIDFAVRQQEDQWAVSVPNVAIEGDLRDYPLTLQAAFDANSNLELDIDKLVFTQGDNRLAAAGQVSEQAMSLQADIALRQLQSLSQDLAGTLVGTLEAGGSLNQPQLRANVSGNGLRFAENRIEQLELAADVQGIDDPELDIQLVLGNLNAGGQSLSDVEASLVGRLSQHQLKLDVQGADNAVLSRVLLSLNGRFDQQEQLYQARITPLEVDSDAGDIRLEAPLDLRYNLTNGQARLSPFCLRREQGGLICSEETINASAQQGNAVLSVREVPMEMVEPFLPEQWQLTGDTTADLDASWRQGGAQWQANMQILSELAITAVNDYGQSVQLPEINLDAQVEANQAQADASVALALAEAGALSLTLSVNDPLGAGDLSGELRADEVSLAPYRPMLVGMDRLEGDLSGSVQIAGTTSQPDLQGQLGLRRIRVNGPDIPVDVQDGELVFAFDGEEGSINGFLAAERGRLNITGDAYWPSGEGWRIGVDLNALQEPLLVVLPQFGRLEAAPDIRVRVTPERLQVRGDVNVPWARLEIGDLPSSAIAPSGDEVIITERDDRQAEREAQQAAVNADGPSAADELAASGMELDILVTLTLGRDMQIAAYGLESGLGGTLEIRQTDGALQLFGDVNLVEGRFQAFGQDLVIRRGELLFSGPPGLPTLDFEAIRNPDVTEDDVIAGLRVTGSAEEPNVRVFSEPAMNESRALSYLLRGRAPDASGGGIDSALTTALIGMSLGRTGGAVGSIGEAFGIDDLTLDTAGAGDESQVAVSGQLTDDIRVSYGVGIFSPIAELTLRYTLWRNLYLQAVSGTNQAVDLIYSFTISGDPEIFEQQ
ncbi:translocation/assembly module TamB domain-containing protein [Halovibrio sp. HP20-50]|uniref:autotransporter assembly complex protein TamB n=1 Tax=Halovibrio sp. HP20-59 TaxID=3080275 RepID=UPI00294B3A29|nr:translocation/assembly module TamB domain-containing protein [Halovibrio sp. HP20-59]MEA2117475.1 translocation/assembly module TamB domain-containing protein [Halovibrio sp. HP20-59]